MQSSKYFGLLFKQKKHRTSLFVERGVKKVNSTPTPHDGYKDHGSCSLSIRFKVQIFRLGEPMAQQLRPHSSRPP